MANKRSFKKYVAYLTNNVCQDMMIQSCNNNQVNHELIDEAIIDVLKAGGDAVINSNVQFDKCKCAYDGNIRAYRADKAKFNRSLFKKINNDFLNAIENALKKFNSAIPQEIKDQNKSSI